MIPDSKRVDADIEDRFSALPRNLVDDILRLLPVHDASRTSIFSKNWRYTWAAHPNLMLDKTFCSKLAVKSQSVLKETIDMILLQHIGEIVKFDLDVSGVQLCSYADIDRWMLYVTRYGVKELALFMQRILITLTVLRLIEITFVPATEFYAIKTPLLLLNAGTVPKGLHYTLNCLWHLKLGVNFNKLGQTCYTLELIKSFPNLSKLEIWDNAFGDPDEAVMKYLDTPSRGLLFAHAPSLSRMSIKPKNASSSKEELNVATEVDVEDRFSALPRHLIDDILMLLPVHDAARTSILSKIWRYTWAALPNLMLDKHFFNELATNSLNEIVEVNLLQHIGDIVKIVLDFARVNLLSFADIDRWMLYVTRKGVNELILAGLRNRNYRIPSHWLGSSTNPIRVERSQLGKLLSSVPRLEGLSLSFVLLEILSAGTIQTSLPFMLNCLCHPSLNLCFGRKGQTSYAVELIKSSPNLSKLEISLIDSTTSDNVEEVLKYLNSMVFLNQPLHSVKDVVMHAFEGSKVEMLFVKLLFACTPSLIRMQVNAFDLEEGRDIATELMDFPRASPKAELICTLCTY
ncbi:hypothetical protein H5410_019450 [Solanum commersonii]|uniref:F-box domain-containing protein n=1 Tax=Solanum commersonii TaxID=4109 RepID=A0A9J5Z5M7_SOLCO|nr:hypothetical protein H5410_019450 [Solanum commersonii]